MAAVGSVPQRARLGHGPRGLQRRRRRLVLLPAPTTRAPARTAGTRTAWAGACPDDRQRLCSRWRSGTARIRSSRSAHSVSPARRATTARTSRSTGGSSTRAPHPLVDALAVRVPAARGTPYQRTPRRGERPPRPSRPRVRARSTPASSTRGSLLRRGRRLRQGGCGRHPASGIHRDQPRPDTATLHLLPTLWFRDTWEAGGWGWRRPTIHRTRPPRALRRAARGARHDGARERRRRRGAVFCDNATTPRSASGGQPGPPSVSEGRHQPARRRRRRDREPGG